MTNLWAQYQRIPYADNGRDLRGCDCWGLLCIIYRDFFDIELPKYAGVHTTNIREVVRAISSGYVQPEWIDVPREQLRIGDAVVMALVGKKLAAHVGIYIGKNQMIHAEHGSGVCIVNLQDYTVRERIIAYRRHVNATR